MRWLWLIIVLIASAVAQNVTGANTRTIRFAGAPTGSCQQFSYAVNNATGDFYDCLANAWFLVGPSPGGGGTVTSFSSGNLSPLFTTSVATPTTTPALSFTLSNAAAHTFLGNSTGSSAVPAYGKVDLSADVTSNLPVTNLNSGTSASSSTFWRGDGTWAAAGTGTVTSVATTSPITGGTFTTSGTIACATCATTTNGGALSATSPVTISAAGVIACTTCNTTSSNVTSVFTRTGAVTATSGDYTLDLIGNPAASVSFTAPATNTYSFLGTAPASVSGAGTAAGTTFTLTSPAGGATTGSATTGGTGGDFSLTTGTGGSGSGGTNATGGRAGNFTLILGAGGAKSGTGVVGAPGQFGIQEGLLTNCAAGAESTFPIDLRNTSGTGKMSIATNGTDSCLQTWGGNIILNNEGNSVQINTGLQFTSSAISQYKGIITVSGGVPAEYATIDLTAQSAAKTATTLYAATATGMFRACWSATITTAATTSSVLGGTSGFQIVYTSPTDSVSKTTIADTTDTSAANTTGTAVGGCKTMYVKTGTTIQYQFDYTSVGGTAMVYELHIKAEAL